MTKVSGYNANFIHVILELVEDGQRLEFDVHPGMERRKVRFEIGASQGYGELYIERFETADPNEELDIRVRLVVPPGSGDRPAVSPVLQGTYANAAVVRGEQVKKAAALPQAEDGQAFAPGDNVPSDVTAQVEVASEPGVPTAAELSGVPDGTEGVQVVAKVPAEPTLAEISADRQFTAPNVSEETALQKLVRSEMMVTPIGSQPEPTPEEIALMTSTTPPKVGEEKELDAKNRGKKNAPASRR